MTFKIVVRSALDEYLREMHTAMDGLTPEDLRWQPDPGSNHITWLVWHMARVEDGWMSEARKTEQVWATSDWPEKLGLADLGGSNGWGWDAGEVAGMPEISKDNLIGYYADVRAVTFAELDKMTDADMSLPWSHPKSSLTSIAPIFGHIIVEESQHLGQIAFIRGMLRGTNN